MYLSTKLSENAKSFAGDAKNLLFSVAYEVKKLPTLQKWIIRLINKYIFYVSMCRLLFHSALHAGHKRGRRARRWGEEESKRGRYEGEKGVKVDVAGQVDVEGELTE